jgi:ubiquitin thioesterase OTU1
LVAILIIVVATSIRNDPERFNDATLGRPVDEYCAWITRANRYVFEKENTTDNSWGGEIELAVLSEYFKIGIDCVDVKTQHVYSYGESYPTRCILIYSGIHYDALAYTFIPEMPEADITIYQIDPPGEPVYEAILTGAKTMAHKLKERGYNVDTATFNIVCEQCGKGFIGEKEAVKHAEETGHTAFGQIPAEEDD